MRFLVVDRPPSSWPRAISLRAFAGPIAQKRPRLREKRAYAASAQATEEACNVNRHVILSSNEELGLRFEVLQEIGRGGNAVISCVRERTTGKHFACKTLPKELGPEQAGDHKRATHLESIKREIDVLQKLKGCLNVVELHAVFEDKVRHLRRR